MARFFRYLTALLAVIVTLFGTVTLIAVHRPAILIFGVVMLFVTVKELEYAMVAISVILSTIAISWIVQIGPEPLSIGAAALIGLYAARSIQLIIAKWRTERTEEA